MLKLQIFSEQYRRENPDVYFVVVMRGDGEGGMQPARLVDDQGNFVEVW